MATSQQTVNATFVPIDLPKTEKSTNILVLFIVGDLERADLVVRAVLLAHLGQILHRLETVHLTLEEKDMVFGYAGVLGGLQRNLDGGR